MGRALAKVSLLLLLLWELRLSHQLRRMRCPGGQWFQKTRHNPSRQAIVDADNRHNRSIKGAALMRGPFLDLGNRRSVQGLVTGKLAASAVATELHCGCPQPLALTPSCWPS